MTEQHARERGRITARAPIALVNELEEAAALLGVTVNQFLLQVALKEARLVIEAHSRIDLSRQDAVFIANLLHSPPGPNDRLLTAASRYKSKFEHGTDIRNT